MNNDPSDDQPVQAVDELRPEYHFDFSKSRPNRFAASFPPGGRLVVLDPDIAQVFTTAEAVNSVLRALITTMPPSPSR
jgi:hypothetical protein